MSIEYLPGPCETWGYVSVPPVIVISHPHALCIARATVIISPGNPATLVHPPVYPAYGQEVLFILMFVEELLTQESFPQIVFRVAVSEALVAAAAAGVLISQQSSPPTGEIVPCVVGSRFFFTAIHPSEVSNLAEFFVMPSKFLYR